MFAWYEHPKILGFMVWTEGFLEVVTHTTTAVVPWQGPALKYDIAMTYGVYALFKNLWLDHLRPKYMHMSIIHNMRLYVSGYLCICVVQACMYVCPHVPTYVKFRKRAKTTVYWYVGCPYDKGGKTTNNTKSVHFPSTAAHNKCPPSAHPWRVGNATI